MMFLTRAVIAILAGVGSGLIGFWAMWNAILASGAGYPGVGFDTWLVGSIFAPGVLVALAVFHIISGLEVARPKGENAPQSA
jgi:hypothetical protein